MALAPDRDLYD